MIEAALLLAEVRSRGVELFARAGTVRIRGSCPPDLRERLRRHRAELLTLVEQEAESAAPAHDRLELLPLGATPDRPPFGWMYLRAGSFAGCWIGPNGELDSGQGQARGAHLLPVRKDAPTSCWCCRRSTWWRLGAGRPWTCSTCHPPSPGIGPIERRRELSTSTPSEASDPGDDGERVGS